MNRQTPRGHWILLLLGGLTLTIALLMNGFAHGLLGEGPHHRAAGPPPPAAAARAGPLLNLRDGTPRSARPRAKTIALTFDDGPDPRWTPKLLEVLRRHGAHATFFVVGARVAEHPRLARRMVREGHELGNHTYTHVDMAGAPAWRNRLELDLTQRALAGATGVKTRLLRMPYSATPDALSGAEWRAAEAAGRLGYLVTLADRDTEDWRRPGAARIVQAAIGTGGGGGRAARAAPGAVIMMHDSGGDRVQTVAAVDKILTRLAGQGHRFTTVSEAFGLPRSADRASFAERLVGHALVAAQRGSAWIATGLTGLFAVAAVLTAVRLGTLLLFARIHVGRVRRARRARRDHRAGRRRRRGPPARDDPPGGDDLPGRGDAPGGAGPPRFARIPAVSVVVPAYNEAAGIAATVRSLLDTDYPGPVEVIVVDDGSTDDTAWIVESMDHPAVRLIMQPNGGKPSALNTGIAYAGGEMLVLVDGDTVFQHNTLRRLVAPLADRRIGAVSGNTKVANRGGILGRWQHIEYVIGFNLDRRMFDVLRCMPTVPGAIGAFRRTALRSAGGVSDDTLAEDTDLTMAVCRAGWRVVYEESAVAWTEAPSSLRQLWRQRYRWCYGTLQAMWKHRRSMLERGRPGRFGRRCLTYLTVFQILLPLFAPAVDVFTVYGLVFLEPAALALSWGIFVGLQAVAGAYALRLDGERLGILWTLPLQQVVYRQLMYLVVIQSLVTAAVGGRLRWHPIRRTGTFSRPTRRRRSGRRRTGGQPARRPAAQRR